MDKNRALRAIASDSATVKSWERNLWLSVQIAREEGATWDEIGEQLGVTKQAAQQRFRDV